MRMIGWHKYTQKEMLEGKVDAVTFTNKKVTKYSFQIRIIWFILKSKRTTIMEVGSKFSWIATA